MKNLFYYLLVAAVLAVTSCKKSKDGNSGLSSSTATRVIGTVTFDENEGTFIFHGCKGHYRGWQNGKLTVDRDATAEEVETYLTQKYYYSFEESGGNLWMQIRFEPGGTPSSFRSVE